MPYLGKHRAPRPLILRTPVIGGVVTAVLLAWPVLMVTTNAGTDGHGTRVRSVADGSRQPTSGPADSVDSTPATSVPVDRDEPGSSVPDTEGGASSTRAVGGSGTRARTSTGKPAVTTTRSTRRPTSTRTTTRSTSKPATTTKPPTTRPVTKPPSSNPTTTPAEPTGSQTSGGSTTEIPTQDPTQASDPAPTTTDSGDGSTSPAS